MEEFAYLWFLLYYDTSGGLQADGRYGGRMDEIDKGRGCGCALWSIAVALCWEVLCSSPQYNCGL